MTGFSLKVALLAALLPLLPLIQSSSSKENCTHATEEGWKKVGTKCFKIFTDAKRPWLLALRHCQIRGGTLALPENEKETSALRDMAASFKAVYFWIGATDIGTEGTWISPVTLQPLKYTDWGIWQPQNQGGHEHCALMDRSNPTPYQWHDFMCTVLTEFICERQC